MRRNLVSFFLPFIALQQVCYFPLHFERLLLGRTRSSDPLRFELPMWCIVGSVAVGYASTFFSSHLPSRTVELETRCNLLPLIQISFSTSFLFSSDLIRIHTILSAEFLHLVLLQDIDHSLEPFFGFSTNGASRHDLSTYSRWPIFHWLLMTRISSTFSSNFLKLLSSSL